MITEVFSSWPLRSVRTAIEAVAFWIAVILPIAYVPPLLGVPPHLGTNTLLGLLGVHALAVIVGHGYGADVGTRDRRR